MKTKRVWENYLKTVFLAWIMDTMNSQYIPSNLTIYRIKYLDWTLTTFLASPLTNFWTVSYSETHSSLRTTPFATFALALKRNVIVWARKLETRVGLFVSKYKWQHFKLLVYRLAETMSFISSVLINIVCNYKYFNKYYL